MNPDGKAIMFETNDKEYASMIKKWRWISATVVHASVLCPTWPLFLRMNLPECRWGYWPDEDAPELLNLQLPDGDGVETQVSVGTCAVDLKVAEMWCIHACLKSTARRYLSPLLCWIEPGLFKHTFNITLDSGGVARPRHVDLTALRNYIMSFIYYNRAAGHFSSDSDQGFDAFDWPAQMNEHETNGMLQIDLVTQALAYASSHLHGLSGTLAKFTDASKIQQACAAACQASLAEACEGGKQAGGARTTRTRQNKGSVRDMYLKAKAPLRFRNAFYGLPMSFPWQPKSEVDIALLKSAIDSKKINLLDHLAYTGVYTGQDNQIHVTATLLQRSQLKAHRSALTDKCWDGSYQADLRERVGNVASVMTAVDASDMDSPLVAPMQVQTRALDQLTMNVWDLPDDFCLGTDYALAILQGSMAVMQGSSTDDTRMYPPIVMMCKIAPAERIQELFAAKQLNAGQESSGYDLSACKQKDGAMTMLYFLPISLFKKWVVVDPNNLGSLTPPSHHLQREHHLTAICRSALGGIANDNVWDHKDWTFVPNGTDKISTAFTPGKGNNLPNIFKTVFFRKAEATNKAISSNTLAPHVLVDLEGRPGEKPEEKPERKSEGKRKKTPERRSEEKPKRKETCEFCGLEFKVCACVCVCTHLPYLFNQVPGIFNHIKSCAMNPINKPPADKPKKVSTGEKERGARAEFREKNKAKPTVPTVRIQQPFVRKQKVEPDPVKKVEPDPVQTVEPEQWPSPDIDLDLDHLDEHSLDDVYVGSGTMGGPNDGVSTDTACCHSCSLSSSQCRVCLVGLDCTNCTAAVLECNCCST